MCSGVRRGLEWLVSGCGEYSEGPTSYPEVVKVLTERREKAFPLREQESTRDMTARTPDLRSRR